MTMKEFIEPYNSTFLSKINNTPDEIIREIKNAKIKMKHPRLNIIVNTDPKALIEMLNLEKLTQRGCNHHILIATPTPSMCKAIQIRNATKPMTQFHSVLYFINYIHRSPRKYTFNEDAYLEYEKIFNKSNELAEKLSKLDIFLR